MLNKLNLATRCSINGTYVGCQVMVDGYIYSGILDGNREGFYDWVSGLPCYACYNYYCAILDPGNPDTTVSCSNSPTPKLAEFGICDKSLANSNFCLGLNGYSEQMGISTYCSTYGWCRGNETFCECQERNGGPTCNIYQNT